MNSFISSTRDEPQRSLLGKAASWAMAGIAVSAAAYAGYARATWLRYGHRRPPTVDESDRLLDRFMPVYDVVDRHRIRVEAPAAVTLDVAQELELSDLPVVRAIFKCRELLLRARPDNRTRPKGLLDDMLSLGWSVLAEIPGREIVVGSVTRPWEPNVTFRSIPSTDFASFAEPNYVKIVWTLRADPIGDRASVFRTETRALATDGAARMKFRRYWSLVSPGVRLIRRLMVRPLKRAAERLGHERFEPHVRRLPAIGAGQSKDFLDLH
jgi:hypothetical protein